MFATTSTPLEIGKFAITVERAGVKPYFKVSENGVMLAELYSQNGNLYLARMYSPTKWDDLAKCVAAIQKHVK